MEETIEPSSWEGALQLRHLSSDVRHLSRMAIEITAVLDDQSRVEVPVVVLFSHHCFTRKAAKGENLAEALFREDKRDSSVEHRMLDPQRLEFSRTLPSVLRQIAYAMVFKGSGQMLYRVMPDPKRGGDSGWWLCLELDVNVEAQELRLSVKSCHYRATPGDDTRHQEQILRFLQSDVSGTAQASFMAATPGKNEGSSMRSLRQV